MTFDQFICHWVVSRNGVLKFMAWTPISNRLFHAHVIDGSFLNKSNEMLMWPSTPKATKALLCAMGTQVVVIKESCHPKDLFQIQLLDVLFWLQQCTMASCRSHFSRDDFLWTTTQGKALEVPPRQQTPKQCHFKPTRKKLLSMRV